MAFEIIMVKRVQYFILMNILLHVNMIRESICDIDGTQSESDQISQLALYRKVFKQKRLEQMIAVENILKMDNYAQKYKIVNIIFEKIFKVMHDAKIQLTQSGYVPGEEFPTEHQHKEAIGHIVENTAFFGDIVLRLPDIAHKIFRKDKDWELLALWSISFTNSTTIYDEMDSKLINLMAQELKLIPREPNFFNPFGEEYKRLKNKAKEEENKETKAKKKRKAKRKTRGPKLSHVDL